MIDKKFTQFLGIPYELNGRDEKGLDCAGLVIHYFKRTRGIDVPCGICVKEDWKDNPASRRIYHDGIIEAALRLGAKEILNIQDLESEDVVLFEIDGYIAYMGIYAGENHFMHINEAVRTVVVTRLKSLWKKRFKKGYRICRQLQEQ